MKANIKKEYKQMDQTGPQLCTQCKEQDSSHQHTSSVSSPLQLWSH